MFNSVEYESGGSTIVVFWYGYGNIKRKLPHHLLQKPNQKKELKNNAHCSINMVFRNGGTKKTTQGKKDGRRVIIFNKK